MMRVYDYAPDDGVEFHGAPIDDHDPFERIEEIVARIRPDVEALKAWRASWERKPLLLDPSRPLRVVGKNDAGRRVVEAINAKVNTFSNGREFLTAVRSRVFDLVFLDLRMPEVDGFGVLAELRAQDLEMPIIVLSAVTQRESVVKAFQAGVKSYLVKPLKPEHILRKTLEILKANF